MGKRKRISRKQLKHDALVESASKTTRFVEEHMSKVAIAVVAVIVVVLGWNMLMRARRQAETEAYARLTNATQTLNSGIMGQASDQLQAIVAEYPGTRSAGAATCYLGALRFREGSYEEALGLFERGIELARLCRDRLEEVEQRVTQLLAAEEDEVEDAIESEEEQE